MLWQEQPLEFGHTGFLKNSQTIFLTDLRDVGGKLCCLQTTDADMLFRYTHLPSYLFCFVLC